MSRSRMSGTEDGNLALAICRALGRQNVPEGRLVSVVGPRPRLVQDRAGHRCGGGAQRQAGFTVRRASRLGSAAAVSGGEIGQPLTSAAGRRRQRVSSSLVNSSPGSSMCRGRGPRHRLDLTHRLGRHMPVLRRCGQVLAAALTSSDCAPAGSYCGVGVRGAAPVLRCGAVGGVRDV